MPDPSPQHRPRIADRLAAARRARFVGRATEIDLLRSALFAELPPFVVLHVYGPGGIGKTSLLHEFARVASEARRPVVRLDGRNIEPTPSGFMTALGQALDQDGDPEQVIHALPAGALLLIDTYERLTTLDGWLRDTLLPRLPAPILVVICGRNPPADAWRSDIDWSQLTHIVRLGNLQPDESRAYLSARGVRDELHEDLLRLTRGHPLALALVAELQRQGTAIGSFQLEREPEIVRLLLERIVEGVPDQLHRRALWISVLAWATTETLLADILELPDAHDLFEWLRGLSFMEEGEYGLFPHDLVRDLLDADLRWRNAELRARLGTRLATHLHDRFLRARGLEQQRIWFDRLFLSHGNPGFDTFFDWNALGTAFAEPAVTSDYAEIVAMVRHHQGAEAAGIAEYWLERQPGAILAFRDLSGELLGFMANISIQDATPDDLAIDPAVRAALDYAERHGPVRAGEEMAYLRFWMSKTAHQAISAANNLAAINVSIYWTTHARLAWSFIAMADPDFWEPHFRRIHVQRAPEADFETDGRRYGVFAHDWRVETAEEWLTKRASGILQPFDDAGAAPPTGTLTRDAFEQAVRQALRDYNRPDRLAHNPLLQTSLVQRDNSQITPVEALRQALRAAVETLSTNPRDRKRYRALWHTYFEPAATQELAAELLDLPFGTYRYQLAQGINRIAGHLWQQSHG